MKKTFYVVRIGRWFLTTPPQYGDNFREASIEKAAQFGSVSAALVGLQDARNNSSSSYPGAEIVRVDREVTPGKTSRRIVKDGEVVPVGAKWVIKNPYSDTAFVGYYAGGSALHYGIDLKDALTFDSVLGLMRFAIKHPAEFASGSVNWHIVRIVEETSQATTKDTLMVLA